MTRVKAEAKWVKSSHRKINRVAEILRGVPALKALDLLKFMPQKGARILEQVVKSAIANAKNNFKMKEETLVVTEAYANQGVKMKRWQAKARGRVAPLVKKTCHVTIMVEEKENKRKAKEETDGSKD